MIHVVAKALEVAGEERWIYVALDDAEPAIVEIGLTEEQAQARAELKLKGLKIWTPHV